MPLGVIGIIFEARPNVSADSASLCLKSGNAVLLKGGREALRTNQVLCDCLREAAEEVGLPADFAQLLTTRDDVAAMQARLKALAEETAEKLKGLTVKIYAKTGKDGRLFGAITSKEISDALLKQHKIEIAKQKIVQNDAIKSCGTYPVKCKLGFEINGTINVVVAEEQ